MNLPPPTSQLESFESELIRRFFHPKSYFYLCLTNQIEILSKSESASAAAKKINRLVTNLVAADDAFAEWKQFVMQPGMQELHLVLSGKIIWLSQQASRGDELRAAIESIARALIDTFIKVIPGEGQANQNFTDLQESETNLFDFPVDISEEGDAPELGDKPEHSGDFFAETTEHSPESGDDDDFIKTEFSEIDLTGEDRPIQVDYSQAFAEFENPAPLKVEALVQSETESSPAEPNPENPLYQQFTAESVAAIRTIIEKFHTTPNSKSVGGRFGLLQEKLPELISLAMIQGKDIVEDLAFKLLNLIPMSQKSTPRLIQAFFDLAEDTLNFMINWLGHPVSEIEIRDKFYEIQEFTRIMAEDTQLSVLNEDTTDDMNGTGETEKTDQSSEALLEDTVKPESDGPENSPVDEIVTEDFIFDSFRENGVEIGAAGFSAAEEITLEKMEDYIEAVPVGELDDAEEADESHQNPDVQADDTVTKNLIHLPGDDDNDLRQLINEILTSKNEVPSIDAAAVTLQTPKTLVNRPQITEVTETDLFKSEAALYLKIIEDALANLREQPQNLTFLEDIELSAYSIKRLAQKMGFELLSRLPEQIELSMVDLSRKRKKVSRETIINISDAIQFLNNLEKNDSMMKDKLKNLLTRLDVREKQIIY